MKTLCVAVGAAAAAAVLLAAPRSAAGRAPLLAAEAEARPPDSVPVADEAARVGHDPLYFARHASGDSGRLGS